MGYLTGTIYKATGGFYYVHCSGGGAGDNPELPRDLELVCRGRGVLRKDGRKPVVGDRVEAQQNEDGSGTVAALLPRKNELVRPPLANLDYMVVVLSVTDPAPNLAVVDKYLAVLEHKEIEPLIAVTKTDKGSPDDLVALYRGAGFSVFSTNPTTGEGVPALAEQLRGRFSAFSGNSGVGKSSLLNALDPSLRLEVGDTSKKLGRGRHTTRHVETYRLPGGGFAADTPGFTSLELVQMSGITKEELAGCFREFGEYTGSCRFPDCAHNQERDCGVRRAVEEGKIAASRHQSYRQMYEELRQVREWERR